MPEDLTFKASSLCSLGPRPQIMTGLFLTILRDHFSDADNIEHDVFRERLYQRDPDQDIGGILIEDATVWTPTRAQMRPAIIVKRNAWQHQKRLALDGKGGSTLDGKTTHMKLWRGSHSLFCLASEGGETEALAAEVYRMLMRFGPVFRESFKLLLFDIVDVGAVNEVEEENIHYAIPITVAYAWTENWTIREHASPIRDTSFKEVFSTYYSG